MRLVSIKNHIAIDYSMGIILLLWPWPFLQDVTASASYVMIVMGAVILTQNLITKSPYGIFPLVPFKFHLFMDYILGAFLAASPWLLGFQTQVILPHIIFGIALVALAFVTDQRPSQERDVPINQPE